MDHAAVIRIEMSVLVELHLPLGWDLHEVVHGICHRDVPPLVFAHAHQCLHKLRPLECPCVCARVCVHALSVRVYV